jgi:hypothetical protein
MKRNSGKGKVQKMLQMDVLMAKSEGNYTWVQFSNGGWTLVSYSLNRVREMCATDLALVRRGVAVNVAHATREGNSVVVSGRRFEISRRMVFSFLVVMLLGFARSDSWGQVVANNDVLTGCKSIYTTERVNVLGNDTDSSNEIETDSANYYPVRESAYVEGIRNVSAGDVFINANDRRVVNVRWTDGVVLVDSLSFEYRVADSTAGGVVLSNWALVTMTAKYDAVRTAGSYSNTTLTTLKGCRMVNRGKTVFEAGAKYDLKVTNGASFGPGTEFKAGSVVLIVPE